MEKWHCDVCDCDVDKSQKARHEKTKKHINKTDDLVPMWFCEICNKSIVKNGKSSHLKTKKQIELSEGSSKQ